MDWFSVQVQVQVLYFPREYEWSYTFQQHIEYIQVSMGRKAEKAMLISLLTSGELKNTHKRTHDIWNIKNWKTFLHKHYWEHIVYMRTWIHTPCIITIFFRCQPFKWRDISRDLVSFFFNNVAHSCRFFSQKVITVTADSQVTKMSEGTVVAKSRT